MTMTDPERIAAGLTKAQRDGVLSGGYNDDSSLRGRQRPMFYKLSEMGLFAPRNCLEQPLVRWDCPLTELGKTVRSAILGAAES